LEERDLGATVPWRLSMKLIKYLFLTGLSRPLFGFILSLLDGTLVIINWYGKQL
jgi:hypothetical protein